MKSTLQYVLGYVYWAISIAIAAVVALVTRDVLSNGITIGTASGAAASKSSDFYLGLQLRTVDTWSYFVFGILLVIVIVFLEHFYRAGVEQGKLQSRFLLVTAIDTGVLTLAHFSRFVFGAMLGSFSPVAVALPVIELIVAGIIIWLLRRTSAPAQLTK